MNYREGPINYGNLMYDRRVVRGNTYAMQFPELEPEPVKIKKQHEAHKKMLERKQEKKEDEVHAPEMKDVGDRSDVQTELYLEEILDRIIEVDMECQTDAFIKRLPSPVFIPQKTGVDVATQIEEGELFDFDIEVKPMLEVLVGKTLEQALLEVMEEEDLRNLWAHQYAYLELHNAELAEVQRLEENERRHKEEKERRMAMQYEIQTKAKVVAEKVAAHAFSIRYLADLIPSVFISLRNKGFFYDEIQSGYLDLKMSVVSINIYYMLKVSVLNLIINPKVSTVLLPIVAFAY
uniref:Radial spoke head 3 n=1 Tax=Pseudonaja textilis TaxID=8673 RepID=A0A670XQ21_PSETE